VGIGVFPCHARDSNIIKRLSVSAFSLTLAELARKGRGRNGIVHGEFGDTTMARSAIMSARDLQALETTGPQSDSLSTFSSLWQKAR
jgi:hypothetical protein